MSAKKSQGKKAQGAASGRHMICQNRQARRNYTLGDRFEAGVSLLGTEVKACRAGGAQITDAYVSIRNGEAYLANARIDEYAFGNRMNHAPTRERKLLLHRREIEKLAVRIHERGRTIVPLALYFKRGRVKVELAEGTGKTHEDRRQDIRSRDVKREMERAIKRRR